MPENAGGRNRFRWQSAASRAVCLLVLPLCALGIYLSVRLAIADESFRENTPESIAEAVRLEGGNAAYHDLLAEQLESSGLNPDGERELAVRLSPMESSHWIGLGVRSEVERDYPRAERYLLQAAKVNRGFEPRWALMNFYFRRGNKEQFAIEAKEALEINYDDPTPIFRLCWLAGDDPPAIEKMLPARKAVWAQYLDYLEGSKRVDAAQSVAHSLSLRAEAVDLPVLLRYCDGVMDTNIAAAIDVWNSLCRRRLEPFNALSPAEGRVLTNGDFRTAPTEHGFDWKLPRSDGVFATPNTAGISFELTGNEPQDCVLMSQSLPLAPGHKYRLDYEYRGRESALDSGLRWELGTVAAPPAHSGNLAMTGAWSSGNMSFEAGSADKAVLNLRYTRALGTVRYQGVVAIRKVAVEPVR